MNLLIRWLIGLSVCLPVLAAAWWWQPGVTAAGLSTQALLAHLGILLLTALFVERASEVVLTSWRAEQSDRLALMLAVAEREHGDVSTQGTGTRVTELRYQLLAYKARTRLLAMRLGLCLGLLAALAGVRALAPLVDMTALLPLQRGFFHGLDIALTAALVAGGSDGVHKLTEFYRTFLEGQSARARQRRHAL